MPNLRSHYHRRKAHGNTVAEFGPTLFVILLAFAFPFFNLMGLALSAATVMLTTNYAVGSAASQATYAEALNSVVTTENFMLTSGFAKFAKISATGGFQNCGVDLFTQVSTYGSGNTGLLGPNTPVPTPVNATNQMCEYVAMGHFQIAPFISMSGIPLVNQIPGLGQPLQMNFRAVKMVEHPQGLSFIAPTGGSYNGQLLNFSRATISTAGINGNPNSPVWRTPNIYEQIQQAGETVIGTTVLTVQANQLWQASGITTTSAQNVWMDTTAVGTWDSAYRAGYNDQAAGAPVLADATVENVASGTVNGQPNTLMPYLALVAFVGATAPTPPDIVNNNCFFVGNTLLNYHLPSSGNLNFICNGCLNNGVLYSQMYTAYLHTPDPTSGYVNNTGAQLVRVIVTQ